VIEAAQRRLPPGRIGFGDAVRALQDAAEEVITRGRVFVLGAGEGGPIVGSIVSGVGIVEVAQGIELVRVDPAVGRMTLGWFAR